MKRTLKVFVVKDPEGSVWKTPKGKSSWNSVGAAKNAWCCHHGVFSRCSWSVDAVGWSVEQIAEYELKVSEPPK